MSDNVIVAAADMLLPLTMLGLGLTIWLKRPCYGEVLSYRTKTSLKSKETWERAQEVFGRLCTITFAVLSFLSLIAGIFPIAVNIDDNVCGIICLIVTSVQGLAVLAVIAVTEGVVRREFDKDGTRKVGGGNG